MIGTLAQMVALASFGNGWLKNGQLYEAFYSENSTFQYCNRVDFRKMKRSLFASTSKESIVAATPVEWYELLKNDGCQAIRLYFEHTPDQATQDHKTAGFVGGGGIWIIETVHGRYSHYWRGIWGNSLQAQDKRIWSVKYVRVAKKFPVINSQPDVGQSRERLDDALQQAACVAYTQDFPTWGKTFDEARKVLEGPTPEHTSHCYDSLVTENYSLYNRQLLFAASHAFVFGTMGSWNDLYFNDEQERKVYEDISARLYDAINEAVIAAVNSY